MEEGKQAGVAPEMTGKELTESLRRALKDDGRGALTLKKRFIDKGFEDTKANGDHELESEALANVTLAFRHIEDAAMRLGKVLQALNGGESIYDNSGVVEQK